MDINSFGDLSTRVLECFGREDFSTANLLVTNHGHRFPEERWHIDYWRMILAVLVGEGEAANPILKAAIDDGMWWPARYLGQDEFKPHLDAALLEASYSRAEADRSRPSPRLLIHSDDPEPNFERLLFVIHRNHSDARRELANWLPALPPGLTVALP